MPLASPRGLRWRETRGRTLSGAAPLPCAAGVLVLDDELHITANGPGGLLLRAPPSVHYLDVSGIHATCLHDFGGSPEFWRSVTKLYACNCGLSSLAGLELCPALRWLYLEHNALPSSELLRIGDVAGQLETLDVRGNVGMSAGVAAALQGRLRSLEWLNGARLRA